MRALLSGSYDPITLGHVNIIERAAKKFDEVIVAVMNNDSAKYDSSLSSKVNMFTDDERLLMAKLSTEHIKNVRCIYYPGRLIDACDEYEIDAVVRGVRNSKDFEYEMIHALWNREHNERADTLFLPSDKKFDNISSSNVKKLISEKNFDAACGMLDSKVIDYLKNKNDTVN